MRGRTIGRDVVAVHLAPVVHARNAGLDTNGNALLLGTTTTTTSRAATCGAGHGRGHGSSHNGRRRGCCTNGVAIPGDADVSAGPEGLLVAASEGAGSVGADAPVVAGRVGPLKMCLRRL